jgi:hypothetical protein
MSAQVVKLKTWHAPKIETIVDRRVVVGPMGAFVAINTREGRWIIPSGAPPTVAIELNIPAWVTAIADAVGPRIFYSAELMAHAKVTRGQLLSLIGKRTIQQLGQVLSEISGKPVDGCRIERIGEDRTGAIWRVLF